GVAYAIPGLRRHRRGGFCGVPLLFTGVKSGDQGNPLLEAASGRPSWGRLHRACLLVVVRLARPLRTASRALARLLLRLRNYAAVLAHRLRGLKKQILGTLQQASRKIAKLMHSFLRRRTLMHKRVLACGLAFAVTAHHWRLP